LKSAATSATTGVTVIKHLALSSFLALGLALSLAGCQKSPDLGRVKEETLELVKVHVKALDQLQRRSDALLQRGQTLGAKTRGNSQGIADAGRILTEARAKLDQLRGLAQSAPKSVEEAMKAGNDEEMYKLSDEMVEKLEDGATLVRADLDAVEQWLAIAEGRPAPAAPVPPPTPPTPPPAAAGSAAPVAPPN